MDVLLSGGELPERQARHAKSSFQTRLKELRAAAEEWGVRSSTPEGAVISALIGTIAELGELSDSVAADMGDIVRSAEAVARAKLGTVELEVEKLRVSLVESAAVLNCARAAVADVGLVREGLAKKVAVDMSADILAEMKPHLGRAVILRERDRNWRAYGFASLAALGFVVVGIVIGVWGSSGSSLAEASIDQCAQNPTLSADGHAWCDLSHLPHVSARPAGETSPLTMGPATLR